MIPMLFKESFSLKLSNFSPSPSPCLPWSPGRLFWSVRRLSQGSPPSKLFQHDTKRFGTWPSGGFRCQDHWPGEAQRGACTDARRTWLLWCHVAWRQWFVGKFLLGGFLGWFFFLGGFGGEWRPKMPIEAHASSRFVSMSAFRGSFSRAQVVKENFPKPDRVFSCGESAWEKHRRLYSPVWWSWTC